MGSKYVSIYVTDLVEVTKFIGSRNMDLVRWLSEDPDNPPGKGERWALGALMSDEYPKAKEHEQAHEVIRAFERLCQYACVGSITIEMYPDPDETPVLWDFLFSGSDDDNPLRLPFSPDGTPAVAWHSPEGVALYRARFEQWRSGGEVNERLISLDELDSLVAILAESAERGRGVFAFFEAG